MDKLKDTLAGTFNGISQITFLQKPWFGFIIFLGLFSLNVYSAVAVLIGTVISYFVARALYDRDFAITGLASFNTVLLMLMIYAFLGGFTSLIFAIPASLICMLIFYISNTLLKKVDLVPFAIPSVLSTYTMIIMDKIWPGLFFTDKNLYKIGTLFDNLDFTIGNHFLFTSGDIYLQASLAFSLLLIVCFFIFEKEYVIYLLASYFFSLLIFYVIGLFFTIDIMSFTTFNVLLGMMAMKAFGLLPMNKMLIVKLFLLTLAIVLVKFALDYLLGLIGLPSIVLPFIVVCDSILIYQNMKKKSDATFGQNIS